MTVIKDTTFTQCVHGEPKCEKCKNVRVIEWISVKDRMPEKTGKYLCSLIRDIVWYLDNYWFDGDKFQSTHSSCITHWADISRLKPE